MKDPTGNQCQCAACERTFSTENNFTNHRKGDYPHRECMTDAELISSGFNESGSVWRKLDKRGNRFTPS